MSIVLAFENLTLGYDRHPAIHHLQTQIEAGSLTAVVGPNGAGKSTLLKGIIGALLPLEGRVTLGGLTRSDIAYLPQQSEIDRSFPITVVELVAMGLWRKIGPFRRLSRADQARVDEATAAVGLTGLETRSIGSLSGGQMQRALFARLLVQDARLVLLDEPFNAIDASTRADLTSLIQHWHGEGRTILAVLHNEQTVKTYFPSTLMLARELVSHGPTHRVLTAENEFRARQMCEAPQTSPHICERTGT